MRVLVVLYKFGETNEIGNALGSFSYFLDQLESIKKRGVEIEVLAPWVSWFNPGSKEVRGIKVIRYWPKLATRSLRNALLYKLINRFYLFRTKILVERMSKKGRYDLIYVRQARETGYAVAKAKTNIPKVFQPITTWRWHFDQAGDSWIKQIVKDTKRQRDYSDYLLKNFDYFITYNQTMVDEYVALGAQRNKFEIIPGAVDHAHFAPQSDKQKLRKDLQLPLHKKIILYVGRINFAEKGIGYLLQAFDIVLDQVPDAYLLMIGPGTDEEVGKLELGENSSYLGPKKYQDLPEFMNAADIGVVPSIWFESSGRVSLDMLSCGLPTIVSNSGGLPEYSIDGKTGYIIKPKDADLLAESIVKILRNEDLRNEMSQNARKHILENYTFQNTTKKYVDFFNSIILNSKP